MHIVIQANHVDVVLPNAVDVQIETGQAFVFKAAFFKTAKGGAVSGHDVGLNPVKVQFPEGVVHYHVHGHGHNALSPVGFVQLVAQMAGLEGTPDDVVQSDDADDLRAS